MPVSVPFLLGGRQLTIDLAEPVFILRGDAHDTVTNVLRGEVELMLSKPMSASNVVVKLVGKSHMLWPEGLGSRSTKLYHEKCIHEQNMILQSWPETTTLPAGLHRWPFEFLLPNQLVETIEDEMAKTFYYCAATVHRGGMGTAKLRCRRNILLLRTPHWSDSALTDNSLQATSISSERRLGMCDATICIEKSIASSGTQFPITFAITPNHKHVHIEAISVILQERRVYRLPEFNAKRGEVLDFQLSLSSVTSTLDPCFTPSRQASMQQLRHVITTKNAHVPLDEVTFQHRYTFTLPNCVHLNHTTSYHEIYIRHYLKIHIELSEAGQEDRTHVRLETPITILDCRLKEDTATLPTYDEALADPTVEDDCQTVKPSGFFICPCYLEYKKKQRGNGKQEWMMTRQNAGYPDPALPPPPPYDFVRANSGSSSSSSPSFTND